MVAGELFLLGTAGLTWTAYIKACFGQWEAAARRGQSLDRDPEGWAGAVWLLHFPRELEQVISPESLFPEGLEINPRSSHLGTAMSSTTLYDSAEKKCLKRYNAIFLSLHPQQSRGGYLTPVFNLITTCLMTDLDMLQSDNLWNVTTGRISSVNVNLIREWSIYICMHVCLYTTINVVIYT